MSMKPSDQLEELLRYYSRTRRVGHTTIALTGPKGSKEKPIFLVHSQQMVEHVKQNFPQDVLDSVDVEVFRENGLVGLDRPVILDNGLIYSILSMAISEIITEKKKYNDLKQKLKALAAS